MPKRHCSPHEIDREGRPSKAGKLMPGDNAGTTREPSSAQDTDAFKIAISLRSSSKAALNDPKPNGHPKELMAVNEDVAHGSPTAPSTSGTGPNAGPNAASIPMAAENMHSSGIADVNRALLSHLGNTLTQNNGSTCLDAEGSGLANLKNEILLDDDSDNFSDRSSLDEFAEWPWLEQIDGVATEEESRVATCDAKLIRRDRIRSHFWAKMEAPADETADLAYELFDTHGRLDRRLYAPGYKRGTDVWGSELDHGDILLFHELQVASQWRRLGIGSRIVQGILQTVRGKSSHFFALVRPGYINRTREADPEDKIGVSKIIAMATQFWQSLGFRRVGSSLWFAFADDVSHPSRKLNASEDWNPPKNWKYDNLIPDATQDALTRIFLSDNPDAACVRQLRDILPPEIGDTRWLSTDDSGNTVLHLAAMSVKPGAVEYVLSRRPDLASTRNHDGNTPLETLQANMESMRTRAIYGRRIAPNSDRFNGFGQPALACVGILSGTEIFDLDKLSPADRAAVSSTTDPQASSIPEADLICHTLRLNYGCICGECIGGFLSPRMQYALLCQAEFQHDLMQDGLDLTGPEWHSNYGGILNFLPTTVQENLKTNKSMRQGFINMCNHISTCLKRKKIPNEDNVLFTLRNETSEWPPVTENYLEGGGTVAGVATILFEEAMYANQWSGDVTHQGIFQDKIEELPACRNDDEFGFVSGMCGYIRVSNGPSIDMLDDLSDTD